MYRTRPLGELILGALYEWAYSNGDEIRGLMPGFLKLDEKEEARLNARLNQSKAFELGRLLGEGAAVAQGIYEFIAGSAAVGGGSGLCITGIGCFAGAPAIATGVVLQAHGGTLAVNSASEFGDKLRDILSPNRMESTGGADDVIGLSRETGISQESINKVYGDIEPVNIRRIGNNLDKNSAEHLFNKGGDDATGSQLVKNVSDIIGRFTKNPDAIDVDAIDSVKGVLLKNKRGRLSDSKTEAAFSETLDFLKRRDGKVSGDFPTRFADAQGGRGAAQARNEIKVAEDILDGNSPFGNTVSKVEGIPTNVSNTGIPTPDYRVIDINDVSRLAEVKTPQGLLRENNLQRNLNGAIDQIKRAEGTVDRGGYIIIDYSSQPATSVSPARLEDYTRTLITDANATDIREFVEILYKNDSGDARLLLQIENGVMKILN